MEYPKIATLFERNEDLSIDPTRLKRPVYGTIKEWDVTEKVDGTNIRVSFMPGAPAGVDTVGAELVAVPPAVYFNGRTDAAHIPGDLLQNLAKLFPVEKLAARFQTPVVLYGEGYGAGIKKVGNLYRPDKSFILFDVLVNGTWWVNTREVQEVAKSLEIDAVPYIGRWSLDHIIRMVKDGVISRLMPNAPSTQDTAEGIVARPIETLFDSRHERVILKRKTKDFQAWKR